jgi:alpha-1,2-mannosyltransferase
MLLSQLVAVSTVSSLFLVHYSSLPSKKHPRISAGRIFRICIMGAIATVVYTPLTIFDSKFLPNLLIMHGLLLVPLFLPSSPAGETDERSPRAATAQRSSLKQVYYTAALVSFVVHVRNTLSVLQLLPPEKHLISFLTETLFHHPAQSSISLDVVCTHIIWMSWIVIDYFSSCRRRKTGIATASVFFLALTAPFASIAAVAPLYLALREDWVDAETQGASVDKAK